MANLPVRKQLLPPYLENDTWKELLDAVDKVLNTEIDRPVVWLNEQRNTWTLTDAGEKKVTAGTMLQTTDFESVEKPLLIQQANMLGFDFKESDLLETEDYHRLVRNIALYWFSKGKPDFVNFMGFVLNTTTKVTRLWSTRGTTYDSYGAFFEEGDPAIGVPVWEGGTWFPTTHVAVTIDPFKFAALSMSKLTALFYALANYNLVFEMAVLDGQAPIHTVDEAALTRAICLVPVVEVVDYAPVIWQINNLYSFPNYYVDGYTVNTSPQPAQS